MKVIRSMLTRFTRSAVLPVFLLTIPVTALAAENEPEVLEGEAVISTIDRTTREISLFFGSVLVFNAVVPNSAINLEDINVGDKVAVTYSAAVETDLSEPTEEELADPWKVLEEGVVTQDGDTTSINTQQLVRAVVTVKGLNMEGGVAAVEDSRNMVHYIGDIEPDKLAKLKVGDTVLVIFEQAMVLTLDNKS